MTAFCYFKYFYFNIKKNIFYNMTNHECDYLSKCNSQMTIWMCGHNDSSFIDIDLDNLNKFNVNYEFDLPNISYMNKFFNEFVCWYYVWKNNMKSDIVVTAHYSRLPMVIDIDNILQNNSIQYYFYDKKRNIKPFNKIKYKDYAFIENQIYEYGGPDMLVDDVVEYLKIQSKIPYHKLIQITSLQNSYKFVTREIFAASWETYCDLVEFIYEFIQFIKNKYSLHNINDWKKHFMENIIKHYRNKYDLYYNKYTKMCYQNTDKFKTILNENGGYDTQNNCWRVYGYIIEILISIYILSHNSFYKEDSVYVSNNIT